MKTGNKDIGPGEKGMIHSERSDGGGCVGEVESSTAGERNFRIHTKRRCDKKNSCSG